MTPPEPPLPTEDLSARLSKLSQHLDLHEFKLQLEAIKGKLDSLSLEAAHNTELLLYFLERHNLIAQSSDYDQSE